MLNPVPMTVACEIVTLLVPVLLIETGCVLLVPSATLPNARLDGAAFSDRLTPVPESDTVAGEFAALLTTATLPVAVPATVGANFAWNVAL